MTNLSVSVWKIIEIQQLKMDDFESVFLQDDLNNSAKRLCAMDRLKIGEVFQVRHNQFIFVCIHCTQEFQQFQRFTAHVQNHYHNALQWLTPASMDACDGAVEMPTMPSANSENVEWLFSDSSNDDSRCEDDDIEPLHEIECKVNIHEDDDELEHPNDCSVEVEDSTSVEMRFKLKHPLIHVKDTADTRKFLPYFSKRFSFKRTEDQRFKCPLCDYIAISKANVREHIFTHSEMKIFSCKLCSKDFSRPRNILLHVEQKHSDVTVSTPERASKKLKIEKIDSLDGICSSKNILISPKVKVSNNMMYSLGVNGDKTRSQCYICMKTFSRPNGIVKHMKTHTQEKNYQCFTCGSQFSRSDHLNRHMLIHEEPKFKCDICDMTFRRSDKMLLHRRKHPETMNYTCENCGLGFMELSSIKTHVNFHCKGRIDIKPNINEEQTGYGGQQTAELNIETHPGVSLAGADSISSTHLSEP